MHQIELEWIQQLQSVLRSTGMDYFFIAWNYVDTLAFSIFLISAVWYLINRRIGIRLLYILILSAVINKFLKGFIGLPRPCQIDSLVGVLCSPSPGFPSGAAQTAILIAGIVFIETRKTLYRWLGVFFALVLSFSRIYLGLHYFSDILGGWVIGGLLLVVYSKLFPLLEKKWKRYLFLFPILLLGFAQAKVPRLFGFSIGVAIGLLLYEKSKKYWQKGWRSHWLQFLSVLIGIFVLFLGMHFFPAFELFFALAIGFWLSFLGAWSVQKIRMFIHR